MRNPLDASCDAQYFRCCCSNVRILISDRRPKWASARGISDRRQGADDELPHIDILAGELEDQSIRHTIAAGYEGLKGRISSSGVFAVTQRVHAHFLDIRVVATGDEPFNGRLSHALTSVLKANAPV